MTILRTDTISGIGTEGTVFEGDITVDSLNYMTLPKGTTDQRYSLEGRDPDYHKLKLHLPLVQHTQFDDYSPASPSITVNYDSHISSKSGVFENSAGLFSRQGANDWLAISDSNDLDLGSDDFTIECWFMCTAGGTNGYLVQKGTASGNWSYFIQFREATDSINFYATSDGTNFDIVNGTSFGSTISPNRWYHVAVCRSGNTFSYYINGQKGATTDTSSASFHNSNVDVRIPESGGFGSTEEVFLQDVRLYKGVAKYSETFTPQKLAEVGATRYNTDSNKIECYDGTKWMNIAVSSPDLGNSTNSDNHGGTRGVYMGGDPGSGATDAIDYINIESTGTAVDFGNLQSGGGRRGGRGCGSRTRGIHMGGAGSSPRFDLIDYITLASEGTGIDFGNLKSDRTCEAASNQTRGLAMGGSEPGSNTDKVDYITIASTGNAVTFGTMTNANRSDGAGFASPIRAFQVATSGNPDSGEYLTIPTTGGATEFTDGSWGKEATPQGASNSTRGLAMGGSSPSYTAEIRYIEMASLGHAVNFGDLTVAGGISDGTASRTRAVAWGRYKSPGTNDGSIDYVAIATQGNAVDFGDMNETRRNGGSTSTGHGGL